jgi:hypothetical protein
MNQDELFLQEIEQRLAENRKLMQGSVMPRSLAGVVSYLGFHTFRSLFIISFLVTLSLFVGFYDVLVMVSRGMFLWP